MCMDDQLKEFVNTIYKDLGPGYNECVYHKAMEVMLRAQGVQYESERIVPIVFHGHTSMYMMNRTNFISSVASDARIPYDIGCAIPRTVCVCILTNFDLC